MSWTISGLTNGIGDIFSSAWDGVKNNAPLLGAIAGGADAYAKYNTSANQAKIDKEYRRGILADAQQTQARKDEHNKSINEGPKINPKQVYRI